jgi:hypothetical protein
VASNQFLSWINGRRDRFTREHDLFLIEMQSAGATVSQIHVAALAQGIPMSYSQLASRLRILRSSAKHYGVETVEQLLDHVHDGEGTRNWSEPGRHYLYEQTK